MKKVTLTFVGDIFPANLHQTIGFGIANQFSKHNGKKWVHSIQTITKESDVVFGNLESPLLYDHSISLNTDFAGSYRFSDFLKKCNFNILSIANNHILEQGEKGFSETIKILKDKKIEPIGINTNGNSNIIIKEINNIKIGIVAYNSVHDIKNKNLYAPFDLEKAIKALDEMKKNKVECKIISLHWGWYEEYINIPSAETIKIARELVDSGADIIVGHHPHVVQPIEVYKDKLIFYSLGNFLFDMLWSKNVRIGLTATVIFDKISNKFSYELKPIYLNYDYTPILFEKNKFNKLMKKYTDKLKIYDINKKKYIKKRFLKMKFNQYYQRIMMKIYLIKNWNRLSKKGKIKYLNKLKKKLITGQK